MIVRIVINNKGGTMFQLLTQLMVRPRRRLFRVPPLFWRLLPQRQLSKFLVLLLIHNLQHRSNLRLQQVLLMQKIVHNQSKCSALSG